MLGAEKSKIIETAILPSVLVTSGRANINDAQNRNVTVSVAHDVGAAKK